MNDLIKTLTSKHLATLKPYESARRLFSGGQDWLNANESPFTNQYDVDASRFNRYPACQPKKVIDLYSEYSGLASEQVLVTRGADEGIELLVRTFCTPGKSNVLICPPTYGMYAISAETHNVGIKKAPLQSDFSLDLEHIKSFRGSVNLVFICSPNNPTGTSIEQPQLLEIIRWFKDSALVIIDEAYIEFDYQNSCSGLLAENKNLVILRTLSKAFALAGLRCGFTLADEAVIHNLLKVIAPYPIAEPVAQIAAQSLTNEGVTTMQQQVQWLEAEKALLKNTLQQIPAIKLVGDDKANFILFRCEQKQGLMDHLVSKGILIRDQSKQHNLDNCLRISTFACPNCKFF
jgi:histidinol-phosphate aminotransferase